MRLRLKKAGESRLRPSKPLPPVPTAPDNKNDSTALLERPNSRLYPLLIESNGDNRFCCPTFEVEDFLMCCRYLYYCRHTSLISDTLYDEYEKVFLKYNLNSPLSKPGSDKEEDYEPHVRALGLYFNFKLTRREKIQTQGWVDVIKKLPRKKLLIRRK